jgi:glycosyltransferase involved in cell wall biosynthesis
LNSTKKQYPYLAEKLFPINFGSNIEDDYFPDTNYLPESIEEVKLLAIGTNYKRKGIDQAEVLQKTLGCQLDIIGIKKKLDKSNSDEVSEMVELYKNAHFLLLFSEADCTPIVVNEASSFGLPVLAYDAGGISEIVNDSVNGFVVDSIEEAATKIKSLLENKEEYTKLSASARAFYEKELNWDKFEQRLLQ